MKKIILTATLLFSAIFATAQSLPKVGIRGGVNLSKLRAANTDNGNSISTDNLTNFRIGGYIDFDLGSNISVQPGLELNGKGGKTVVVNGPNVNYQLKSSLMYLEIPVNFLYNIPAGIGKIYLGGGPYGAFGVSGKYKTTGTLLVGGDAVTNTNTDRNVNFGNDSGDDFRKTDFGVNVLGGFQFDGGLNIGVNYGLGLSDITPNTTNSRFKQNNRLVGFTIGYFF